MWHQATFPAPSAQSEHGLCVPEFSRLAFSCSLLGFLLFPLILLDEFFLTLLFRSPGLKCFPFSGGFHCPNVWQWLTKTVQLDIRPNERLRNL